jgi:hypothetical protein
MKRLAGTSRVAGADIGATITDGIASANTILLRQPVCETVHTAPALPPEACVVGWGNAAMERIAIRAKTTVILDRFMTFLLKGNLDSLRSIPLHSFFFLPGTSATLNWLS